MARFTPTVIPGSCSHVPKMDLTYPGALVKHPLILRCLLWINRYRRLLGTRRLVSASRITLEKLGVGAGGWFVPTRLIQEGWIVYSGGVGEDITFDLELIR